LGTLSPVPHVLVVDDDPAVRAILVRMLLRELRERFPDIAAVMVTGDDDVVAAVESLKLGAQDYLTKPLVTHVVRARVAKALDEHHTALENRRLRESYQADLELQVRELDRKNRAMFLAQVQMAAAMLEEKDAYTRGHSQRVAEYAVATGRHLGLSETLLKEIRLGGELHDIGKIGTRDDVLHKASRLDAEELAHIREHTIAGERILSVLKAEHPSVVHIARWHHERMDGAGFPDGLRGEEIPLSARIVCVVDAFDAMISNRPYASVRTPEWAISELLRCAGDQFDPEVVAAFIAVHPIVKPTVSAPSP
jgi:putative two-component system response regulator